MRQGTLHNADSGLKSRCVWEFYRRYIEEGRGTILFFNAAIRFLYSSL